jgi:uncharacterized membrane protein
MHQNTTKKLSTQFSGFNNVVHNIPVDGNLFFGSRGVSVRFYLIYTTEWNTCEFFGNISNNSQVFHSVVYIK